MFFDPILSEYQCGFRQDYGFQNYLHILREEWRKNVKNLEISGAFLINLSKSFDCL